MELLGAAVAFILFVLIIGGIWLYIKRGAQSSQAAPLNSSFNTPDEMHVQVQALAQQGNKLQAIKLLRQQTGMSLAEAKQYVEQLSVADGQEPILPSSARTCSAEQLAELRVLAQQGQKIEAIKRYREITGVGLKEAKDTIDAL